MFSFKSNIFKKNIIIFVNDIMYYLTNKSLLELFEKY